MSCPVCEHLAESEYDLAEQAAALRLALSEALAQLNHAQAEVARLRQATERQAEALRAFMAVA